MRTAVTGALTPIVKLRRQKLNNNSLFDCLHLHAHGRTNEHYMEIVFVDYIRSVYAAILRQIVKCIALCQTGQK